MAIDELCTTGGSWTLTGAAMLDLGSTRLGRPPADKGILLVFAAAGAGGATGQARNASGVTVTAGQSYALNFWARSSSPPVTAAFYLNVYAGPSAIAMQLVGRFSAPADSGWYAYSAPITATAGALFVAWSGASGDDGDTWEIDDVAIASVPATTATWIVQNPINPSSSPNGLPEGQVGPGVRVTIAIGPNGAPVDPEAARILATADYTRE